MSATCDSPIMAKLAAINLAVNFCLSNGWISDNIYCDCQGVADLLKNFSVCMAWHINEEFCKLKRNLDCFPHTCVEYIPREDNEITDILVDLEDIITNSLFFIKDLIGLLSLKIAALKDT